jgi:hypothetical protein
VRRERVDVGGLKRGKSGCITSALGRKRVRLYHVARAQVCASEYGVGS